MSMPNDNLYEPEVEFIDELDELVVPYPIHQIKKELLPRRLYFSPRLTNDICRYLSEVFFKSSQCGDLFIERFKELLEVDIYSGCLYGDQEGVFITNHYGKVKYDSNLKNLHLLKTEIKYSYEQILECDNDFDSSIVNRFSYLLSGDPLGETIKFVMKLYVANTDEHNGDLILSVETIAEDEDFNDHKSLFKITDDDEDLATNFFSHISYTGVLIPYVNINLTKLVNFAFENSTPLTEKLSCFIDNYDFTIDDLASSSRYGYF